MNITNAIHREQNIVWVDSLKGIGIVGVVIAHTNGFSVLSELLGVSLFTGGEMVYLLLLISCFLIFFSLERSRVSTGVWIKLKLVRLLPLFYLICVCSLLITGGNSYWLGTAENVSLGNVISHFLLIFDLCPFYVNSIIGVEWYLGVLFIFFLICPVLFRNVRTLWQAVISFCLVSPLCVAASHYLTGFFAESDNSELLMHYFGTFLFTIQIPVLLMGLILFFTLRSDALSAQRGNWILSYALLVASLVLFSGLALLRTSIFGFSTGMSYGLAFFLLILSQEIHSCPLFCNAVFAFFGRYSFPIYLTHMLVLDLLRRAFSFSDHGPVIDWLILFVLTIAVTVLVSLLLTRFYDRPVTRFLKKRLLKADEV